MTLSKIQLAKDVPCPKTKGIKPCPCCGEPMYMFHRTMPGGRPSGYTIRGKHKDLCFFEGGTFFVVYRRIRDCKAAWNTRIPA